MSTLSNRTPSTVSILAASIGSRHGFVLEDDSARIHADLVVYDATAAAAKEWALQLWACAQPFAGGPLQGTKTAEIWLGAIDEFAASSSTFHATAAFHPPAGGGEFAMVLALVAGRDGVFPEVHSHVNYPSNQLFLLPKLQGKIAYELVGNDRVKIDVECIENPREESNISGTLSLELWALAEPYQGGHFHGAPLAGAILGTLGGQAQWNPPAFDLAFKSPPPGAWYLTLMLREWTGTAYTTRDYSAFAHPHVVREPVVENADAKTAIAPVIATTSLPSVPKTTPPAKRRIATAQPDIVREPVVEKAGAKTAIATVTATTSLPSVPKTTPTAKRRIATAQPWSAASTQISVNTASAAELSTVKRLSKPVAAAIVAGRPFKKYEDLLKVKGIGPKLLAKFKPSLKL